MTKKTSRTNLNGFKYDGKQIFEQFIYECSNPRVFEAAEIVAELWAKIGDSEGKRKESGQKLCDHFPIG